MIAIRLWCAFAVIILAVTGCKSGGQLSRPTQRVVSTPIAPAPAPATSASFPVIENAAASSLRVTPVSFQEALPNPPPSVHAGNMAEEIGPQMLTREWLSAEVEARNPSLEAMIAAWQAAVQLYPQKVALDDPMLMGMLAPQSAASNTTETAYAFQLNQKLPWFGKRSLRGAAAAADADAASQEAEDTRLRVRLAADMAFFEYFLAGKLLELNRENIQLMQQFRDTAHSKYRANQVTEQDVLQADLELAELERRQLELTRMHQVAIARINTLLGRWPDAPLPPSPAELDPPRQPADTNLLWQTALRQRPDLSALAWRVQSEEVALELAYKNYFPDVDVFGRYDTFWQPASTQGPLRASVGVAMNLPVYREKLHAAVCEAQFRLNQRRAEFEQRSLDIQYEVISAAQQVEESRKTTELYAQRLIPGAMQNVEAVRSNYIVVKATFLDLAQTQRQLVAIRERQLEATIAYHRRVAELDRALGSSGLAAAQNSFVPEEN